MDYIKHITVPKNTLETDPKISYMALPAGIIKQVGYEFPLGCKGLAHLTVWVHTVQQWPRSQGISYYGDALYRQFPENFILPNPFNLLTIKTWNLDDTWEHTITIHITVLLEDQPSWVDQLIKLFLR